MKEKIIKGIVFASIGLVIFGVFGSVIIKINELPKLRCTSLNGVETLAFKISNAVFDDNDKTCLLTYLYPVNEGEVAKDRKYLEDTATVLVSGNHLKFTENITNTEASVYNELLLQKKLADSRKKKIEK